MFDPKKLQKYSLAENLNQNDTFGQMQQMKEAKQLQDARKGAAQGYSDNLNQQTPVTTMTKIDNMLTGIYPQGVDPDIQKFYIDLMGKYGR